LSVIARKRDDGRRLPDSTGWVLESCLTLPSDLSLVAQNSCPKATAPHPAAPLETFLASDANPVNDLTSGTGPTKWSSEAKPRIQYFETVRFRPLPQKKPRSWMAPNRVSDYAPSEEE